MTTPLTSADQDTLNRAIRSAQAGDKAAAHASLALLRSLYPTHPDVLLWYAFTAPTPAAARAAIDSLAWVDPNNAALPKARVWLAEQEYTAPQPAQLAYNTPAPAYTQLNNGTAAEHPLFVLDERNRDYAEGRGPLPQPMQGTSGCAAVFSTLFWGLFAVVGVGLLVFFVSLWQHQSQIDGKGISVQATVTNLTIDDGGDSTSYTAAYRYSAGRPPKPYTNSVSVDGALYNSLKEGGPVTVRYLPNSPATSGIVGSSGNQWPIAGVGLAFVAFAILCFFTMRARLRRQRYLARFGQLLHGRVIDASAREDSDNDLILTLRYAFTTPNESTVNAKYMGMHNNLKGTLPPAPDTPLAILYADAKRYHVL